MGRLAAWYFSCITYAIPAAPQETVGEDRIEPGTGAWRAAWYQPVDLTTELPHPQQLCKNWAAVF
jgi:hypothetical protein